MGQVGGSGLYTPWRGAYCYVLIFFCKVLFEKDPSDHGSILFFVVFHFCHFWAFFQFRAVFHFGAFLHFWVVRGVRGVRGGH